MDYVIFKPIIYLLKTLLQRRQLVTHKHPRHVLDIAQ